MPDRNDSLGKDLPRPEGVEVIPDDPYLLLGFGDNLLENVTYQVDMDDKDWWPLNA